MLKTFLGEEDFNKGISNYLKKYSYSNAVTSDLWQALSEVQKREIYILSIYPGILLVNGAISLCYSCDLIILYSQF